MKRTLLALTTTALMLAPAIALAHGGTKGMPDTHATVPVSRRVTVGGLTADFRITAPQHPLYTCPMHPQVTSAKPGADKQTASCGMALVRQNVALHVQVKNATGVAIAYPSIRLVVKNTYGTVATTALKGGATSLYLRPGSYTLTAVLSLQGHQPVTFTIPYTKS